MTAIMKSKSTSTNIHRRKSDISLWSCHF